MSKTFTLRACAAAALLFSATTFAKTPPAPAAAAADAAVQEHVVPPVDMVAVEAFTALSMELTRAFPWRANLVRTMDEFGSFRYAPESAEKFQKVFGTDQPLAIKRTAVSKTNRSYLMTLHPLEYTMSDGGVFAWAPLTASIHTDPAGKRYTFDGSWPFMKMALEDTTVLMSDLSASGKLRRGFQDLWFGSMRLDMKSMTVNGADTFAMEDSSANVNMTERGKLVDVAYSFGARSIRVGGSEPASFDMAGRFTGLPARALAALLDADERLEAITDPVEQEKQTLEVFKKLAPSFAASGGAFHIDKLLMTYKGHSASLNGRLTFSPMKNAAAASQSEILKQLSGKFTLRVPVALLSEIAREVALRQLEEGNPGQPVDEAALAEAANNVKDAMIGKALGSGFAKLEKGELLSVVVLTKGKLTANGKPFDLPAPPPNETDAPQDQAPPPRDTAMAEGHAK